MAARVDEIGERIYRISTFVPEIAPPDGFTFNQFLVDADEPLLFHCGHRAMFPDIRDAVARLIPLEKLRWIAFSHLEADEAGSMNLWLAACPKASLAQGSVGCLVSLNDLADRPPRMLADGEVIDLGGRKVRHLDTPHMPHGWDARLLYEETTETLFGSDVLTTTGNGPALAQTDLVGPAIAAEDMFQAMSLTAATAPTLRRLAELEPKTLALMHGSSLSAECAEALHAFADHMESRLRELVLGAKAPTNVAAAARMRDLVQETHP